jgi:hypothetical protein
MEHWRKLCLVLDTWVVPARKETDPKSEEKLNNVSKPKSGLIDYHQVVLQRKENLRPLLKWLFQEVDFTKWVSKSDASIELVIPAS